MMQQHLPYTIICLVYLGVIPNVFAKLADIFVEEQPVQTPIATITPYLHSIG